MFKAIFVDGPLAGEVMAMDQSRPLFLVPLPERATICRCADSPIVIDEHGPEIFEYHLVAHGASVLLYSKHSSDEDAIFRALSEWVQTDLSRHDRILNSCRDRRAYA